MRKGIFLVLALKVEPQEVHLEYIASTDQGEKKSTYTSDSVRRDQSMDDSFNIEAVC